MVGIHPDAEMGIPFRYKDLALAQVKDCRKETPWARGDGFSDTRMAPSFMSTPPVFIQLSHSAGLRTPGIRFGNIEEEIAAGSTHTLSPMSPLPMPTRCRNVTERTRPLRVLDAHRQRGHRLNVWVEPGGDLLFYIAKRMPGVRRPGPNG